MSGFTRRRNVEREKEERQRTSKVMIVTDKDVAFAL